MIQMLDTYFRSAWLRARGSEEGATATEYIILLVFIALAIIIGATFLGEQINAAFNRAGGRVTAEVN